MPTPTPKPKSTWRRRLIRLCLLLLVGYFLYGCTLIAIQDRIIFPRDVPGVRSLAGPVPAGWEQLTITAEGTTIPAWLHIPQHNPGDRLPAVIFFHGNAEVIDDLAQTQEVEMYNPLGIAVLLVEYRGYGRAGGDPSEKAIAADSTKFYDLLAARPEIDPTRIVYYGRSLGGGAACALARNRAPAAMIMQSCFLSINAMAAKMWVPGFIVRHHFRNDQVVASLDCPILFMHGTHDSIIPCSHSTQLNALAKHGRLVNQDCDHNDFPCDFPAYQREIEKFLRENGFVK